MRIQQYSDPFAWRGVSRAHRAEAMHRILPFEVFNTMTFVPFLNALWLDPYQGTPQYKLLIDRAPNTVPSSVAQVPNTAPSSVVRVRISGTIWHRDYRGWWPVSVSGEGELDNNVARSGFHVQLKMDDSYNVGYDPVIIDTVKLPTGFLCTSTDPEALEFLINTRDMFSIKNPSERRNEAHPYEVHGVGANAVMVGIFQDDRDLRGTDG